MLLFCTDVGTVPSPFDCYLTVRGIKTLPVRMKEHERNAMAVARHLENSPHVEEVIYPGKFINNYSCIHDVCNVM